MLCWCKAGTILYGGARQGSYCRLVRGKDYMYDGVRQGSNDGRGTCLDQSNADDLECSGFSQYRTHSCSSSLS